MRTLVDLLTDHLLGSTFNLTLIKVCRAEPEKSVFDSLESRQPRGSQ
jgi:hypothetical protein